MRTCIALVWDIWQDAQVPVYTQLPSREVTSVLPSSTQQPSEYMFTFTPTVVPSITPTSTWIPTSTVTPTKTPHPAMIEGIEPKRWRRDVADLWYRQGEFVQGMTQEIRPLENGVVSVDMYAPELPYGTQDWLGGQVSGVWPIHFEAGQTRMLGSCSHPCQIFFLDESFENFYPSGIFGSIDILMTIDHPIDGWVVVKPYPTNAVLDQISFRVGPYEQPDLVMQSDNGYPKVGWLTNVPGTVSIVYAKPIGKSQYYQGDVIENLFSTSVSRVTLGVREDDDVIAYYIIPVALNVGDHIFTFTCYHECTLWFQNVNGNDIRASLSVTWTEQNQGKFTDIIGVPRDAGAATGWVIVKETHWGGPTVDFSLDIR